MPQNSHTSSAITDNSIIFFFFICKVKNNLLLYCKLKSYSVGVQQ